MTRQRGGALLAVLWLAAVLTAIAFSVANTVRGETERTGTQSESIRAYYLATSSIDRALMYMELGPGIRLPDGSPRYYDPSLPRFQFTWPNGLSRVDLIPESSKFDINSVTAPELLRLLAALGTEPGQAQQVVAGILDWRSGAIGGAPTMFDQFYLARSPSFTARHASLEETEELLLVKGMTPDLYYGGYGRDAEGRLQPRPGLRDCVSIYGSTGPFDLNSASPALLVAIGFPTPLVAAIEQRRRALPFRNPGEIAQFAPLAGPAFSRVGLNTGTTSIYTLRATARLRTPNGQISDLSRSVGATVKFHKPGYTPSMEVLRWYEN